MKRKDLLRMVRAEGFEGKSLDELKAWMKSEGIGDIRDTDGNAVDVDDVWGAKAILTMEPGDSLSRLEVDTGEDEEDDSEEKMEDEEEDEEDFGKATRSYSAQRRKENARTISSVKGQYPSIHQGNKAPGARSARQKAVLDYDRKVKAWDSGAIGKRPAFSSGEAAERAGAWMRLATMGPYDYQEKSADIDIVGKALATTVNSLGGALIPEDFSADLIELKETFGVARQLCPVIPMQRDTLLYPRLVGDVAPTWSTENATESNQDKPTFDNVQLIAHELRGLTVMSKQMTMQPAISVADIWGRSWARGVAMVEDQAFFLGDGTSTYGNIQGARSKLGSASKSSLTGGDFTTPTLADLSEALGVLPGYVHSGGDIRWVMHSTVFFQVFDRIIRASGGSTQAENRAISPYQVMGHPVVFSQVLPSADPGASTVFAFVGDFSMAAKFGEVSGMQEVTTSDQRYFENNQIAIRGVETVAINVHDAGSSSEAGPIVGLQLSS